MSESDDDEEAEEEKEVPSADDDGEDFSIGGANGFCLSSTLSSFLFLVWLSFP